MGLNKISKIVLAVLGLAGIIFLVRIISAGDEAIKSAAIDGDTSLVEPMAIIAYIVLAVILVLVFFFILKNLFTDTRGLKNTLIGIGAFAVVLVISYLVSGGDTRAYVSNGIQVSDNASHMVGAGLMAFYILLFTSAVTMLFSGIKKMIN
jgi:hypothetical protein